jgi:pimeloyl-ACP methyl ester carboxylesterase
MTVPRLAGTTEIDPTEFGGLDNVLILGPSLGTAAPLWDDALPALSKNYTLVRWDLPGHGKSEPTSEPFTMAELAQGVIDLADAFGIDTFDYAGVSIGGAIALQLEIAVVCALLILLARAYSNAPRWLRRMPAQRSVWCMLSATRP